MSDPLFGTLAAIVILFGILLAVKAVTRWKFCALCFGVGMTWTGSLGLSWFTKPDGDPVLTALMIGGSVVGLYYLFEKKVAESYHVFRLPLLVTLLFLGYELTALAPLKTLVPSLLFMAFLWAIFGILYLHKNNATVKALVSSIVNCCKNW